MTKAIFFIGLVFFTGATQDVSPDDYTSFYKVLHKATTEAVRKKMPDKLAVYVNAYDFVSRISPADEDMSFFFSEVRTINATAVGRWVIFANVPPKEFKNLCSTFKNIDANELANVQYLTVEQLTRVKHDIDSMAARNQKIR